MQLEKFFSQKKAEYASLNYVESDRKNWMLWICKYEVNMEFKCLGGSSIDKNDWLLRHHSLLIPYLKFSSLCNSVMEMIDSIT